MARTNIFAADALLDVELPCLDKGFIRLVDYMGGDARVVQSARVAYGAGTKTVREDMGLINYLLENAHTSPFEQVVLTFHMKLPIFIARQIVRHRTARLNEISGRYSIMKDEFYVPNVERVQKQSAANKQGSGEAFPEAEAQHHIDTMVGEQALLYSTYQGFVSEETDMARELARINLPLSLYTEWYWQIDLHNLLHFLRLRLDWHAQYEVRVYAEALAKCAEAVAPMCYAAFTEHVKDAVKLSATEARWVRQLLNSSVLNDPAGHETQADILDTFASVEGAGSKEVKKLFTKLGIQK